MFWVDAELGSDLYLDGKMLIVTHGYASVSSYLSLATYLFMIVNI